MDKKVAIVYGAAIGAVLLWAWYITGMAAVAMHQCEKVQSFEICLLELK